MPAISTVPSDVARQIGTGRAAFGLAVLAAPGLSLRLLGTDRGTADRVAWLARLFAARDAALGVGAVFAARRGREVAPWLAAGAACDAVDAAVLLTAARGGRLGGPLPYGIAVGAAGLAGLAAVATARASPN